MCIVVRKEESFTLLLDGPGVELTSYLFIYLFIYEGHLESKERFAMQRYLLIIGKKQNIQVL